MDERYGNKPVRLGALVRKYRRQAGLTQQEIADRAGVSVGGLRGLERGRVTRPRPGTLRRLSAALRLTESEMADLLRLREAERGAGSGALLRVLGPLEVLLDGDSVHLSSAHQQSMLGLLAVSANAPVSLDALVEVVWGRQPPTAAAELIQARISRLRRRVRLQTKGGPGQDSPALVATTGGYQLTATDDQLDLLAFRRLIRQARRARSGDQAAAVARYQQAVDLCQGEPLTGLAPLRQHPMVAAVDREWRAAVVEYADFAIALGHHDQLIVPLRRVTDADPCYEPAHARLMTALAAVGDKVAAIELFNGLRRRLANELGIDPTPELRRRYQAVLRGHLDQHEVPYMAG